MVQRKGSTRVSEDAEELVHVPLQAILLADSFAQKFRPITLERPKVNFQTSLSFSLSLSNALVQTVFTIIVYIPLLPKLLLLLIWVLKFIFRGVFIAFNRFTIHVEVLISVILGFECDVGMCFRLH